MMIVINSNTINTKFIITNEKNINLVTLKFNIDTTLSQELENSLHFN